MAEWQTQQTQNLPLVTTYRFKSDLGHDSKRDIRKSVPFSVGMSLGYPGMPLSCLILFVILRFYGMNDILYFVFTDDLSQKKERKKL